jgi:ornithine lipid hydroxylase
VLRAGDGVSALRRGLRLALWPLVAASTTIAFVAGFDHGRAELVLFLVPVLTMWLLFALELLIPDRQGAGSWGDPQLWNDLVHAAVGQVGGNALGQATFVYAAALLAGELSHRFGGNLWPADRPLGLQVALLVLLADGLDYWRHRLVHTVPWLWPIHALHHDVDRLSVLKSGRGHFLDMLTRGLVVYAPLVLAGAPREAMLAYAAAVTVFGPIAHANVSVRLPAFLHRLVLTPQVHRIHHAKSLTLSSKNYADVFPLWDVVFGTFEDPERHPDLEYGVEGGMQPEEIVGQLLAPFGDWRSALRRRLRASA